MFEFRDRLAHFLISIVITALTTYPSISKAFPNLSFPLPSGLKSVKHYEKKLTVPFIKLKRINGLPSVPSITLINTLSIQLENEDTVKPERIESISRPLNLRIVPSK